MPSCVESASEADEDSRAETRLWAFGVYRKLIRELGAR